MLLVCLATSDIWISLGPVFDLVKALFLAIKALYLDHVECVDEQCLLDRVIQWTIR